MIPASLLRLSKNKHNSIFTLVSRVRQDTSSEFPEQQQKLPRWWPASWSGSGILCQEYLRLHTVKREFTIRVGPSMPVRTSIWPLITAGALAMFLDRLSTRRKPSYSGRPQTDQVEFRQTCRLYQGVHCGPECPSAGWTVSTNRIVHLFLFPFSAEAGTFGLVGALGTLGGFAEEAASTLGLFLLVGGS
jgi:hypothetical protein